MCGVVVLQLDCASEEQSRPYYSVLYPNNPVQIAGEEHFEN